MYAAVLWLIAMVALLIFEGSTASLNSIWFAIGAMFAAICAAMDLNVLTQFMVFLVISVVLLLLLRPIAKNYLQNKKAATNADRVLEKVGVVTEDIDNMLGQGAVYVDGKTWTARSYSGEPIQKDAHVSINMIDGVKLVVTPVKVEQPQITNI